MSGITDRFRPVYNDQRHKVAYWDSKVRGFSTPKYTLRLLKRRAKNKVAAQSRRRNRRNRAR